ncbi:helix-turn-helix transcriptional regulator [Bradyrhizobium sp. 191]|nr:helix-turn-helix transcriptional regulator [Bradyrhizobium sp. 143]MCK1730031.1 helix-turn-helix transcriptional regulator [Bradyrhizobium sp. 142]UPJ69409.1 helix-turn-helix transcriptional regulator [Bradyrhizobium sp. 191]
MRKDSGTSPRGTLARNVRRLRLESGMTQEELAAKAATRQALVSAVEVETANPTLDSITRIAAALGVGIADLFGISRK